MKEQNELIKTRIINAPRELVWEAWTDPKQLEKWWGPTDFTNPVCEIDVRPSGAIYIEMQGPDGVRYPMNGTYTEVLKPERIVFTSAALDAQGNALFEVLNTIIFEEENGKTKLTMYAKVSKATAEAAPYLAGMDEGWSQSLVRLEQFIMKK